MFALSYALRNGKTGELNRRIVDLRIQGSHNDIINICSSNLVRSFKGGFKQYAEPFKVSELDSSTENLEIWTEL